MQLNKNNVLIIFTSVICFIALFNGLPYGYFTFLRFVVFAVGWYLAYLFYENNRDSLWPWMFGTISVLFNPFIIIHLERNQWVPIDFLVGIFFIVSIFILKNKK